MKKRGNMVEVIKCPVCKNGDKDKIRDYNSSPNAPRKECLECESIFIYDPPETNIIYSAEYNTEFMRPCDLQKAGIMARSLCEILELIGHDARFLEIGAGNGLTSLLIAKAGYKAEILEINETHAKKLLKDLQIPVTQGHIEYTYAPFRYDLIYAGHVIEHIKRPNKFLAGIHKSLNSRGVVYLDTPCVDTIHMQGGTWKHFNTRNYYEHVILYSLNGIQKLLREEGFSVISAKIYPEYQSMQIIAGKGSHE